MNLKSHRIDPVEGADCASGPFALLLEQLPPATMTVNAAQEIVYRDLSRYSHRHLEAYFGIPMMGAVQMTVNVRLSPEQGARWLQA